MAITITRSQPALELVGDPRLQTAKSQGEHDSRPHEHSPRGVERLAH